MICRIVHPLKCPKSPEFPDGIRPVGSLNEHPEAYLLVRFGCAVPADEECERAADMTPEQMEAAQKNYRRTAKGIDPDDFELFDAGVIDGYDAAGNYIPGPNWTEPEDDEEEPESKLWLPSSL